ncbi:MAG: VTT domain-containing protein [Candidatus Doudnabacteria bacterium]|nr:VTT domain-containing protein [Candidatus Doudnabacteria bacterium]
MSFWHTKKGRYVLAVLSIVLFLGFSLVFFVVFKPGQLVELLGGRNAYLSLFFIAIAGGFTTFNIIPYHLVLITLAAGGLHPVLLGLLAASGVTIGDSVSYFVGRQGRVLLSEGARKWFDRITRLSERRPRLMIFLFFLYSTFAPSSNDLLTIPAGIARIPFWQVMIPLLLGNIIFDSTLAYLAANAPELVQKYF